MKRLITALALAGLVGGTIVTLHRTTQAMPPPPSQVVRIECDGNIANCCGGSGPRNFFYRVKVPSGGAVAVDRVDIGTDDPNLANYVGSSLILPAGWTASIVAGSMPHNGSCTNHGGTTSIGFTCPFIMRFSKGTGVAQTSNFNIGFDYTGPLGGHDVDWLASLASSSNSADWTKPVGLGQGPVHGPKADH